MPIGSKRRRDTPVGGDLFCGGGGGAQGLEDAGIHVRVAANHDPVAIATHSTNHPSAEHFEVDLLSYDVAKLPAVEFLHASPSCVYFSQAKAYKAMQEPTEVAERAVRGEMEPEGGHGARSRVLMTCPLRYADRHRPSLLVVENVIDVAYWGPGRDGSTFRWWLGEWDKLGYETEPLFLNSAAFGVPQQRDRLYVAVWLKGMRRPDLRHRIEGFCPDCGKTTTAQQAFRGRRASWPAARWGALGRQWDYRCLACDSVVEIPLRPIAEALDLTDTGHRIGDRSRPLGESTLARLRAMLAAHKGELPQVTLNRAQADVYDQAFASAPRGCLVPMRRHTRTTQLGLPCHTLTAQQRPAVAFMDPPEEPEEPEEHTGPGDAAGTDAADGTDGEGTPPGVTVDDLRFRMLSIEEMRRIMAYGDDFQFAGPDGREPSQLEKIRLLGNGVTPPVLDWLNRQMLAVL